MFIPLSVTLYVIFNIYAQDRQYIRYPVSNSRPWPMICLILRFYLVYFLTCQSEINKVNLVETVSSLPTWSSSTSSTSTRSAFEVLLSLKFCYMMSRSLQYHKTRLSREDELPLNRLRTAPVCLNTVSSWFKKLIRWAFVHAADNTEAFVLAQARPQGMWALTPSFDFLSHLLLLPIFSVLLSDQHRVCSRCFTYETSLWLTEVFILQVHLLWQTSTFHPWAGILKPRLWREFVKDICTFSCACTYVHTLTMFWSYGWNTVVKQSSVDTVHICT